MCSNMLLILTCIFGASFGQHPSTWSMDKEQSKNINLKGITFFHDKQHTDNNNNKFQNSENNPALYAFSRLMPDQSKLSRVAGLSRVVGSSLTSSANDGVRLLPSHAVLEGFGRSYKPGSVAEQPVKNLTDVANFHVENMPPLVLESSEIGDNMRRDNVMMNFVPKGDIQTPIASEIIGSDINSNSILTSDYKTGSKWNIGAFVGNDVTGSDNAQLINFSKLGIMKDNLSGAMVSANDIKTDRSLGIPKLFNREGAQDIAGGTSGSGSIFDNGGIMGNNIERYTTGSGSIFDSTVISSNKFNADNSALFGTSVTSDNAGDSGSDMINANTENGNIAALANSFPRDTFSSVSSVNSFFDSRNKLSQGTKSDTFSSEQSGSGLADNNVRKYINSDVLANSEATNDIIKPFPFGQLQGSPTKRVPIMKSTSDFINNSRKPIMRVKSKFVDLSGRKNPNMKAIGSFVDFSNKISFEQTTLLPPMSPTTDRTTSSRSPTTINPTLPAPQLNGIVLPGVLQESDVPPSRTNSNSGIDGNRGTILPENNLKVDMLYPPAPFPTAKRLNSNTQGGQSAISQSGVNTERPGDLNTRITAVSQVGAIENNFDDSMNAETDLNIANVDNNFGTNATSVGIPGVSGGVSDVLDYDMYADITNDITDNAQNVGIAQISSPTMKTLQENNNQRFPLNPKNRGDHDRFITDPNVQVINPSNPMVPNNGKININGQILQHNPMRSLNNGQANRNIPIVHNGQTIVNNGELLSKNGPFGQPLPNVGVNGQLISSNVQRGQIVSSMLPSNGRWNQFRIGQTNQFPSVFPGGINQNMFAKQNQNQVVPNTINQGQQNAFQADRRNANVLQNSGINSINSSPAQNNGQNIQQLNNGKVWSSNQANGRTDISRQSGQFLVGQNMLNNKQNGLFQNGHGQNGRMVPMQANVNNVQLRNGISPSILSATGGTDLQNVHNQNNGRILNPQNGIHVQGQAVNNVPNTFNSFNINKASSTNNVPGLGVTNGQSRTMNFPNGQIPANRINSFNTFNVPGNIPQIQGNVRQIHGNVPQMQGNILQQRSNVMQMQGNVPQLQGSVPQLRNNVPQMQGNMAQMQGKIPQLQGSIPQQRSNVPQMQGNVPQMQSNIPQQRNNVPQMQGNMVQMQGNVPQHRSNVQQMQGNVPQLQGSVPQLRNNVPQMQGNMAQMQGNVPQLQGSIPQQRSNVPQMQGNMAQMQGNIPQQRNNIPQMQGNMAQMQGNVPQQRSNVPQMQDNVVQMQGNVPQLRNNRPQMQGNVPQQRSNVPQMQGNIPQLRSNVPNNFIPGNLGRSINGPVLNMGQNWMMNSRQNPFPGNPNRLRQNGGSGWFSQFR